jgi:hypothetical protein
MNEMGWSSPRKGRPPCIIRQSPRKPRKSPAGITRGGGRRVAQATPQRRLGGMGGDAGDCSAASTGVSRNLPHDLEAVFKAMQTTASVDCDERATEPPPRTKNAPVDSAVANGAVLEAEIATPLVPKPTIVEQPAAQNTDDSLSIPDFLLRGGDRPVGPASSNNLTIKSRQNRRQSR